MLRLISVLLAALIAAAPAFAGKKIGGVDVPSTLSFSDQSLQLTGAGVRSKFFVDVYVAALYQGASADNVLLTDASEIIAADRSLDIRVYIISDLITADRFAESAHDGFVRSTHGNLDPIKKEVDTMIRTFRNAMSKGDVFDLVYVPGVGTEIYRNNELQETVPGLEFKQAMTGIWLSDDPVQDSLKDKMLGL
ncbi:MAG: chalcone isomerase family protein [Thalassolituus sp.]